MIGRPKGTLIHTQPNWLDVAVHGGSYEHTPPMSPCSYLRDAGAVVSWCSNTDVQFSEIWTDVEVVRVI